MRIARILTRLNYGGPARQVLASDPELVRRGHELRVFVGQPLAGEGDLYSELCGRGLDVVRVPGLAPRISPARDWRAQRFLNGALRAFAPDVVHTHASKAGALGRRAAARLPGVGTVHTFHGHVLEGYFPPTISQLLVAFERRWATRTDRVIAVSHATADDLVRLKVVGEDKLVVSPPGVELDGLLALTGSSGALREQLGCAPDAFLVGVVGRLAAVKRPLAAVDVFDALAERYPQLQLVFIGDGSERRALERRIGSNERTAARVHLVGARSDMVAVMADLDAVLLCSRQEGMPVALIEAAAAAKPVVARAVGGVEELVAHERTGYLAADGDEMAYGLAQLLDDREAAVAMGLRARLRVEKRHGASALADRLEAVYTVVRQEAKCD